MKIRLLLVLAFASLFFISGQAQTTNRLKVYIKIESEKNENKIASSLRRSLRPHRKFFSFIFPGAQIENDPDITLIVKEHSEIGAVGVFAPDEEQKFYCCTLNSLDNLANHILMYSALKARSLEVGADQALEESQSAAQDVLEKARRQKRKSANATRTKTVTKP
jgi:hypothetical protein